MYRRRAERKIIVNLVENGKVNNSRAVSEFFAKKMIERGL